MTASFLVRTKEIRTGEGSETGRFPLQRVLMEFECGFSLRVSSHLCLAIPTPSCFDFCVRRLDIPKRDPYVLLGSSRY